MKKILALALSMLMLFTFIAACAPDAPPANGGDAVGPPADGGDVEVTQPADTGPADPPPAAAEGENTLTVWSWDPNFNIFAMDQAADIYRQINPDFVLNNVEIPWEDIQTTLITAGTAGNLDILPDIILVQDMAFAQLVETFPEIFTDLTDSGINFGEFGAGKVGFSTVNGRNYGVPFDAGTTIFAVRTDIIGEAGFTVEDFTDITWDQFIEQGQQVLEATGHPMLSTVMGGGDFIAFMLFSAGAEMFRPDGSPYFVGNDMILEVIEIYNRLIETGVLVETVDWGEFIGTFVNDNVAGVIAGAWILGSVQDDEAAHQSGHWAVTNIPRLDVPGGTNYSTWGGSSWLVRQNSPNTELAIDFLANTFAGSVEFYDNILERAGALSTWGPAAASDVYARPQEFFAGQAVFADIVRFTANVQPITIGEFFYESRDALGDAIINIRGGADIETELENAEAVIRFQMGM